jgi:hypothetical protein
VIHTLGTGMRHHDANNLHVQTIGSGTSIRSTTNTGQDKSAGTKESYVDRYVIPTLGLLPVTAVGSVRTGHTHAMYVCMYVHFIQILAERQGDMHG